MASSSNKEKALRRLEAYRSDGTEYKPAEAPSTSSAFTESPVLYYKLFDKNLRPKSEITLAHSLDELYYMAIDNADRLETLDNLFKIRPSFSPKTMTVSDLILTAYVGNSDGNISSLFVCPYQGNQPYAPTTTLYAIAMSEMIPNSMGFPLRIAIDVPGSMKKWSHLSKFNLFGSKASDPTLLQLNTQVNNKQILALRNDPEGCVRYSAQAQAILAKREKERLAAERGDTKVTKESEGPNDSSKTAEPEAESSPAEVPAATTSTDEATATPAEDKAPTTDADDKASLEPSGTTPAKLSPGIAAISGPLLAAKLEDKTLAVPDETAEEANQSHPALEGITKSPDARPSEHSEEMFSNTKALLGEEGLAPPLKRDEA